jgi:hypothetical protein
VNAANGTGCPAGIEPAAKRPVYNKIQCVEMDGKEMLIHEYLRRYRLESAMAEADEARLVRQAAALSRARRRKQRAVARLRRAEQAMVRLRGSLTTEL